MAKNKKKNVLASERKISKCATGYNLFLFCKYAGGFGQVVGRVIVKIIHHIVNK